MAKEKRKAVRQWKLPPSEPGGKAWTVSRWEDGTYSCNCPAWTFKREGQVRGCKHVNGVLVTEAVGSKAKDVTLTVTVPLRATEVPAKRRIVLED